MTTAIKTLTNEELVRVAPSIGATAPWHEVSDKYSFVPTVQAVNYLRDSGWLPVMAGQSGVRIKERKEFTKHMIRFTRPELMINGHRMDLLLYNSHDRGSAFKLVAGVFRFVCSNGMVVGDEMAEFSHRHVGFSPDKFIESAGYLNERSEQIAGVIEDWQALEMTPDEKGAYAYAALSLVHDDPANAPIMSTDLIKPRRYDDRGEDLWRTFNTVQENVIKGGVRGRNKKGRRMKTRPVKSLDRDRKLNQALWMLTERMAELKAA